MVSRSEILGFFPFVGLALVYWCRDRFLYNRGQSVTRTQWIVLLALYPMWAFLEWVTNLQITRSAYVLLGASSVGRTLVVHYATFAICNDAFKQSKQQFLSFFVTLSIQILWILLSVLMFSQNGKEICHIGNHSNSDDGSG